MRLYQQKEWLEEHYIQQGMTIEQMGQLANCADTTIRKWMETHSISLRFRSSLCCRHKEWLEKHYIQQEMSIEEIGRLAGCTGATIRNWLKRHSIPLSPRLYQSREWLEEHYIQQEMTAEEVGQIAGCSGVTIGKWLGAHDIPLRPHPTSCPGRKWLERHYVQQEMTFAEMGRLVNRTGQTIRGWLIAHNISLRPTGHKQIPRGLLEEYYVRQEMSQKEIGKIFNCSDTLIRKALIYHNIPVRSKAEANRLQYNRIRNGEAKSSGWEKDAPTSTGVYAITNQVNGKAYIGSTIQSFRDRWKTHLFNLRHGKNHNSHLQRAWDKYGEDAFEFSVLEIVAGNYDVLIERERAWLDKYIAAGPVYNKKEVAKNPLYKEPLQQHHICNEEGVNGQDHQNKTSDSGIVREMHVFLFRTLRISEAEQAANMYCSQKWRQKVCGSRRKRHP